MKISVALATYNGERFIRDQLQSLSTQTRLPDELIVSDDCSTDRTVAIVESFSRIAPFPVRILRNERNLGFSDNFLRAARLCCGDWIAFCDQDDIWLPAKLAVCERHTEVPGRDIVVVAHNAEIVDEKLNRSGIRYLNVTKTIVFRGRRLPNLWVASGFTMMFRSDLLRDISSDNRGPDPGVPGSQLAHDVWICRLARIVGDVAIVPDCLALYRRHGATTTSFLAGGNTSVRESKRFRRQVHAIATSGANTYRAHSEAASHQAHAFQQLSSDPTLAKWRDRFSVASADYAELSTWLLHKSHVYGDNQFTRRVLHLGALIISNGYLRFNGYSWVNVRRIAKEMAIDTVMTFHGPAKKADSDDHIGNDSVGRR